MLSSGYTEVTGTVKEVLTLYFSIQKAIGGLLCAGLIFQLIIQSWVIFCSL